MSAPDDVVTTAAAFGAVVDPVHVGGRFLWRLQVFTIERYYCPDCRGRVRVPPGWSLLDASCAHACPALLPGQLTIPSPLSDPQPQPKGDCTDAKTEPVPTRVPSQDGG